MEDQEFNEFVTYTTAKYTGVNDSTIKFFIDIEGMQPEYMNRKGERFRLTENGWVKIESEDK